MAKYGLNFVIDDSVDRINMVKTGKVSLAIVSPESVPNEMDSKMLRPDRYILAGSSQWKGRRLVDILENERVIDFSPKDGTTLTYLKKYKLISHLNKTRLFVNSNQAIIEMFAQGVGLGTLTLETAKDYLDQGKLITFNGGKVMEDPQAICWYPRHQLPDYMNDIIKSIR